MAQEISTNDDAPSALDGELTLAPRGPMLTAIWAVTGILLVVEAARLVGRYVLAFRRPAEIRIIGGGLEVRARTVMLGKTLREHTTVIPREGLVRVTREVRYPSLAMYAGLIALALGSYVGVGLFVDGVRAESPSMLGTGFLIALLGLGLDFALSSLIPGALGRSRLVLVPRRGPILCLSAVDLGRADRLLARLSRPGRPPSARPAASIERGRGADRSADEAERNGAGDAR
jgi:hypothetical protein